MARSDSAVHRVANLLITRAVVTAQLLKRELNIPMSNVYRYLACPAAEVWTRALNRSR